MTKLVPADQVQNDPANATEAERKVIAALLEKAQKVVPSAKIRYVERERDDVSVLLVVSLSTAGVDDSENFALYSIAHDLDETDNVSLVITQSSMPTYGNQLLKLRDFLPADKISVDAKEPAAFKNPLWRKAHEPYRGILLYGLPMCVLTVLFMNYAYVPSLIWAQHNFPQFFPGGSVPAKYERKIDAVNRSVDHSLEDIARELGKIDELKLTDEQIRNLRAEKALLEKVRAELHGSAEIR